MGNARRRIQDHRTQVVTVATNTNISGGVSASLPNFIRFTCYLRAAAANNIEYLLSPDGTNFFGAPEGPVIFPAADETVLLIEADAAAIRFVGSTTALTTIIIRGTF